MFEINSSTNNIASLQIIKLIIFLFLVNGLSSYHLISSINTNNAQYVIDSQPNFIGLSLYFDELYPLLNNTLLRGYLNNSRLNDDIFNLFHNSIHMPLGYKYNCSSYYYGNKTINCLFQLQNNTDVLYALKHYMKDFRGSRNIMIGFDVQHFNYNDQKYKELLVQYFQHIKINGQIQFMDRGDKLMQYYNNTVYTPEDFVRDISNFQNSFYWNYLSGPGLSQNASLDWNSQILKITQDNYWAFATYRLILFKEQSQATIQNLLSQNYTANFLTRRFTMNGQLINFRRTNIAINQIRIMDEMGINGVTNSFATAIWALDFTISFALMNGKYIDFFSTFKQSYQSVLGIAPGFEPSPIYYGLLLGIYCLADYDSIQTVAATGNNSQIKAYIFNRANLLIINKDTNPNLTGFVQIKMNKDLQYLSCIYMQAPSLNATSGVTIGGIYWTANDSDFTGKYQEFIYYPNTSTNVYQVNISYAQVAYCRYLFSETSNSIPLKRGRSQNNDDFVLYGLLSLILMIALAI